MQINNSYSVLSHVVNHINNPNYATGTLIEEIPADLGRSWEGYKRGGILEGAEKMRKELMTAVVWMFGIPAFNKLGKAFCENFLKIPMNIDYCNSKAGNNSIKDTVQYIKDGIVKDGLDVSEVAHYRSVKYKEIAKKINTKGVDAIVKQIASAKQITSIAAVALNCLMMGIVLPKFNQKLTAKKIEQNKKKEASLIKPATIEEFKNKTISFKGNISDYITYNTENNNTFRLIITDLPMILGRCATSRNKFEALEYIIMDGGSIFFYNFCSGLIQKMLRQCSKTPDINPLTAEIIAKADKKTIESAMSTIETLKRDSKGKIKEHISLESLLKDKKITDLIYKKATYGKYGKINKFVKNETLKDIDNSVVNLLDRLKQTSDETNPLFRDGKLNEQLLKQAIGKINKANASFLAAGLGVSILGLAVIIPKLTFYITKKITGKNVFTGITNYDDDKKRK